MSRPRPSITFAHRVLSAEFHDLLDQVRLFRLDDAFFFGGPSDKRFDALSFRALPLRFLSASCSEITRE